LSATIGPYWPGITADQRDDRPGFENDYHAYANWMAEVLNPLRFLARRDLRKLGVGALLTFKTQGLPDSDIDWVSPLELADAAEKLERHVLERHPATSRILKLYRKNCADSGRAVEEFAQDLRDVRDLALWARAQRADRLTLDFNW
jgi:hypothetical protein